MFMYGIGIFWYQREIWSRPVWTGIDRFLNLTPNITIIHTIFVTMALNTRGGYRTRLHRHGPIGPYSRWFVPLGHPRRLYKRKLIFLKIFEIFSEICWKFLEKILFFSEKFSTNFRKIFENFSKKNIFFSKNFLYPANV